MTDTIKISVQKATALCRKAGLKNPADGEALSVLTGAVLKEAGTYYFTPTPEAPPAADPLNKEADTAPAAAKLHLHKATGAPMSCFKGGDPRRQTKALKSAKRKYRAKRQLSDRDLRLLADFNSYVVSRQSAA